MSQPLTQYIEQLLPGWMLRAPFMHWLGLAFTTAAMLDALIDALYDGRLAGMPGQVDVPGVEGWFGGFESEDALAYLGRDRRIVRGATESAPDYALRLRRFRSSWRAAGTALGLLLQLQGVLGPNPPRMRIVTTFGTWYTLETNGTFRIQNRTGTGLTVTPAGVATLDTNISAPWDWDSLTIPITNNNGNPFRIWPIIYLPTNAPLTGDEGTWGDGLSKYGTPDKVIGSSGTFSHTEMLRGIAQDWRPGGIKVSHFILAFDAASFDPLTASPYVGLPDGYWGHHGKIQTVAGRPTWVPSRLGTARYVRGLNDADF